MTSAVDICNMALSEIRGGQINSFTEKSVPAFQCNLKYSHLRDQVLRDAPWQFAHKIAILELSTEEIFNWAYAYVYPTDSVRINRLILNIASVESGGSAPISSRRGIEDDLRQINFNRQVKYQILNQGGVKLIVSNETELRADYNLQITDTTLFDPQFVQTFVYLLSASLAVPVVGGKLGREFRGDNFKIYQQYLEAAIASNANEQFDPPPDSEFINARR